MSISYKDSGVDKEEGYKSVEKILEMKKSFAVEEVDRNCPEGQCECHLHHH